MRRGFARLPAQGGLPPPPPLPKAEPKEKPNKDNEDCVRVRYHRPDGYERLAAPSNSTVSHCDAFLEGVPSLSRVRPR